MQANGIIRGRGVVRHGFIAGPEAPLLARFAGKFLLDILPAALASAIGGFLFTQYQSGHVVTRTGTEQITPASAEMMAMVRDEHAMMVDYLKSQMATEMNRAAVEDADAARAVADAKAAEDKPAADKAADANSVSDGPAGRVAAVIVPKSAPARAKRPAILAAAHAPLVIAQADQSGGTAPSGGVARNPASLLAKTLDLEDQLAAATRRVVGLIGDAISSVGERIGGSPNGALQLSSAS